VADCTARFHYPLVVPAKASLDRRRWARLVDQRLAKEYGGTARSLCALSWHDPFELLVATILSAQCTDARVNQVTPELFARYPNPAKLAMADDTELEGLIQPTGFFRSKARSLKGMAAAVAERFGGEVPRSMEDLVSLPGVGRKTANVIRSVAFDLPGLPVDTHVGRVARRLGLTDNESPEAVEADLMALLAESHWGAFSGRVILHGRSICVARRARCGDCLLADRCPSAGPS